MHKQIDMVAVANFALEVLDYNADWEDDEGCFRIDGQPVFYERHSDHFVLEVAGAYHQVPRC